MGLDRKRPESTFWRSIPFRCPRQRDWALRVECVTPGSLPEDGEVALTQPIGGEQAISMLSASVPCAAPANPVLKARLEKHRASEIPFDLSLDLGLPSGITILFGASGAGKTTLLACLAGLTLPDAGKIELGAQVWFDSAAGINTPVPRRNVGYVFQDLALFPHLSVQANVEYGLHDLSSGERGRRANQILDAFRISHLRDRRPRQISGGEAQRVALARSLVTNPNLLLLDEPLAALDAPTKSKIVEDLRAWNQSHRIPVLYVTHSRDQVFALGERVLVIENGRVAAEGTPHDVMSAPRQETVAQLAGFENILAATVVAAHEDRGTMTCRIDGSSVELETPLVRADAGTRLKVGIPAGDILLSSVQPVGLSARNLIPGKVVSLIVRDVIVEITVDCGVEMVAHLTLAARHSLQLLPGSTVWLVIKTHSCRLMAQ